MEHIFSKKINPAYIEKYNLYGLQQGPQEFKTAEAVAKIELGPKGFYGLNHMEGPKTRRIVSLLNPAAEDLALVQRAKLDPAKPVLCFGLGLGYYLQELAKLMDQQSPIWVMESRPELAACALLRPEVQELLQKPGFRLFVGPFHKLPWGSEKTPEQKLWRSATAREFSAEYPFKPVEKIALKTRVPQKIKRLLLFQGGYFLDQELKNAAEQLGLETAVWRFKRKATGDGQEFNDLLILLKKFRPEALLTVNHLGFDSEGVLENVFKRLNIPQASWFVDSPIFILKNYRPGPLSLAFSWDSDYLEALKNQGFKQVHYLPLASDENIFKISTKQNNYERKIAFVGDSLTAATHKFLNKLGFNSISQTPKNFMSKIEEAAETFLNTTELHPSLNEMKKLMNFFNLPPSDEMATDLAALISWRASRHKRLKILSAFETQNLTVAGDKHWKDILPLPSKNIWAPRNYYSDLASFYRGSRVNINITSAQMKSGLNQRIFDVPACGAFLLSDQQTQISNIFDLGQEIITYQCPQEASSLAEWYLKNDSAREKIALAGRNKILSKHLYKHRLAEILEKIRIN